MGPAQRMLPHDVRGLRKADVNCQDVPGGLPGARARAPGVGLFRARTRLQSERRPRWHAPGAQRRARHRAGHGRQLHPERHGDGACLRPDPVQLQPLRATRAATARSPTSPPAHPALGRPAHLHLHPAARGPLRPPVNREVTARDFITAIERLYDKTTSSYAQDYADLIAGATAFGAGKASRISGLRAPNARTLTITLDQPAEDFLSILTLSFFAPVPGEYAANYQVGANYDGHVVGSGPYTPATYIPGRDRGAGPQPQLGPGHRPAAQGLGRPNPDQARPQFPSIQRAIEREEADLSLDSHVPQARVAALRADPERSRRLSVNHREACCSWCLGPTGGPADR